MRDQIAQSAEQAISSNHKFLHAMIVGALMLTEVSSGCVAESSADVGIVANPLYRGTEYSIQPEETRLIALPDGSAVEYTVVAGGWFRPVPLDTCDLPFCVSDTDFDNFMKWRYQYAWQSLGLRVRNQSSKGTTTNYNASVRCVYASGNPLPAPWQTFRSEAHDGEIWVASGETREVDLGCTDYGPGTPYDGAWPVDATIDVSLYDDD